MDNLRDQRGRARGPAGVFYDELRRIYPLAAAADVVTGLATVVGERLSFLPDPLDMIAEIANAAEITLEDSHLQKLLIGMLVRMDPPIEEEMAWDEAIDVMRAAGANIPEPKPFEVDEERLAAVLQELDDAWAARSPEQIAIDQDAFGVEQVFMSVIEEPQAWHPLVTELSAAIEAADADGRTQIGVEVVTIALDQGMGDAVTSPNGLLETMLVWACRGRRPGGLGGGDAPGNDDPDPEGPLPETQPEREGTN